MTDTTISGALCWPQDVGSGVPEDEEDYSSAGFFSLLSKYKGEGSYVGEDTSGNPTLQFNDVDTSNEQVDVSTGYAYIMDSMSVQSGFQTVYDVALPNESPYVVILPDEVVNLDLGTDNENDVWLAVDPTSNDSVYIRHGNGLTAPSDPFVKLGTVNTSSGATTRTNDGAPSGAFRDEDGDNVYTLPNSTDGIDVGSVSTKDATIGSGSVTDSINFEQLEQITVPTSGQSDRSFSAVVDAGDKLIVFYRSSPQHLPDDDDELKAIDSPDYGQSWENDRVIWDDTGPIYVCAATRMASGRIGVLTTPYNGSDEPLFFYSDDNGSTWSEVTVDIPGGEPRFGISINEFPSSVGGDDEEGFAVYMHREVSPWDVVASSTTDNGETWTSQGTIIDGISGKDLMEPTVVRLGTTDKWIMVIRDSNPGPPVITRSTHPFEGWEDPIDTGQELGANPPKLLYDKGVLHWIAASRAYQGREIANFGDSLLYQRAPALDIWEDLTAWTGWTVYHTPGEKTLGYNGVEQVGDRWFLTSGDDEGDGWGVSLFRPPVDRGTGGSGVASKLEQRDVSSGSPTVLSEVFASSDESQLLADESVQETRSVGTSSTLVLTSGAFASLSLVTGRADGGDSTRFADVVLWLWNGGATVIGQQGFGSPAGRTYTIDGSSPSSLQLAMDSGTYHVTVHNLRVRNQTTDI